MITRNDELHHPPDDTPGWQESWYFNWFSGDRFGLARIGYRRTWYGWSCDALAVTTSGGRPAGAYARLGIPVRKRPEPGEGLAIGGFRIRMVEPLRRFTIHAPGLFDVEWTALCDPHDFGEGAGPPAIAPRHFEQSGRVTGILYEDGSQIRIDGYGQRDKSWGQRDWSGIAGWSWLCLPVDDHLGLHLWQAADPLRQRYQGGFLRLDDTVLPVADLRLDLRTLPDGAVAEVRATGKGATNRFTLTAHPVGIFPLAKQGLWLDETAIDCELTVGAEQYSCRGLVEHAYHVGRLGYLPRLPTILRTLRVLRWR